MDSEKSLGTYKPIKPHDDMMKLVRHFCKVLDAQPHLQHETFMPAVAACAWPIQRGAHRSPAPECYAVLPDAARPAMQRARAAVASLRKRSRADAAAAGGRRGGAPGDSGSSGHSPPDRAAGATAAADADPFSQKLSRFMDIMMVRAVAQQQQQPPPQQPPAPSAQPALPPWYMPPGIPQHMLPYMGADMEQPDLWAARPQPCPCSNGSCSPP